MTIQQYTGQPIKVGQWINLDTMARLAFAGSVAQVLEVKPKSIICQILRRNLNGVFEVDSSPQLRRLTSITFISDTPEEADSVRQASLKFFSRELEEERRQREQLAQRRASAISTVLKGE